MKDESHLPVIEQSLIFRLRKRAEIRRNIKDRISYLLEEAANEIEDVRAQRLELMGVLEDYRETGKFDSVCVETLERVIARLAVSGS